MDNVGLMQAIKNQFDDTVVSKIEKLSFESEIFILYLVSFSKVTQRDLEIGFASYKARYPERTFESYLKFKKNFDEDKFKYNIEPQGYFIDEGVAIDYAKKNMGDINECGSFPYVIISSMPLNRVYPTCNFRTHKLFKFNKETKEYEQTDWNSCEGTAILEKKADNGWY